MHFIRFSFMQKSERWEHLRKQFKEEFSFIVAFCSNYSQKTITDAVIRFSKNINGKLTNKIEKLQNLLYRKKPFSRSTRYTILIIPRHTYLNTSRFFFSSTQLICETPSLPMPIKNISRKSSFKKSLHDLVYIGNIHKFL